MMKQTKETSGDHEVTRQTSSHPQQKTALTLYAENKLS